MIIYHNPRCSKSRQALGILRENAEDPDVVEYLKAPLGQAELGGLLKKLGSPAHDLLRTKEDEYDELGLSPNTPEEDILTAIAAHPILLERPIVVKGPPGRHRPPTGTRRGIALKPKAEYLRFFRAWLCLKKSKSSNSR